MAHNYTGTGRFRYNPTVPGSWSPSADDLFRGVADAVKTHLLPTHDDHCEPSRRYDPDATVHIKVKTVVDPDAQWPLTDDDLFGAIADMMKPRPQPVIPARIENMRSLRELMRARYGDHPALLLNAGEDTRCIEEGCPHFGTPHVCLTCCRANEIHGPRMPSTAMQRFHREVVEWAKIRSRVLQVRHDVPEWLSVLENLDDQPQPPQPATPARVPLSANWHHLPDVIQPPAPPTPTPIPARALRPMRTQPGQLPAMPWLRDGE